MKQALLITLDSFSLWTGFVYWCRSRYAFLLPTTQIKRNISIFRWDFCGSPRVPYNRDTHRTLWIILSFRVNFTVSAHTYMPFS